MHALRWLLLKDLRILRRSPLMAAVLVVYPVAIALLIGFALSRGSEKPTVALLNEVPPDEQLEIGSERLGSVIGPKELSRRGETGGGSPRGRGQRQGGGGGGLAGRGIPGETAGQAQASVAR